MKTYKIRHKRIGRFYRGTTYRYFRDKDDKKYLMKVFSPTGKTYSKLAWAKSGLKNITDKWRTFPWTKDDLEIVEYETKEIGVIDGDNL